VFSERLRILTLEAGVGHLENSIDGLDINPLAVIPPGLQVGNA
jgi:hypothetical protein